MDKNIKKLNKTIEKLKTVNIEKSKNLKIDIDNLYRITSELMDNDKDMNYFMLRNHSSIILVFDTTEKLVNFNNKAENFFLRKYNLNINPEFITLNDILNVLNINENNSLTLKTFKTKKRNFVYNNNLSIYISTIPVFIDKTLISVILQIKEKDDNFILKEKKVNIDFEYLNFIGLNDLNIDLTPLEERIKNLVTRNNNLQNLLNRLKLIIHPDNYDEIYTDIMSVVFSNISSNIPISCKVKWKDSYVNFFGNLLLIGLDNNIFNQNKDIKFTVKFAGFIISENSYNNIDKLYDINESEKFRDIITDVNNLQFLLKYNSEKNIEKIIYFFNQMFSFDYLVYVRKSINIFNNYMCKCSNVDSVEEQVKLKNWILSFMNKKIKLNNRNIYRLDDYCIYVKEMKVSNDINSYFFFVSKFESKLLLLRNSKSLVVELISNITKREESKIVNKKIANVSLELLDMIDDWVWMKDSNNNILYMNNSALRNLFGKYFDESFSFNINNTNIIGVLPIDLKELIKSRACNANLIINNNGDIFKVGLKTTHYISSNSDIWYTIARKM